MDDALNDVQSERALTMIGLDIADQIRAVRAEMNEAHRKRIITASGATIGSMGVTLVAIYGPVFQEAMAVLGATGGIWGIIHALAENTPRHLRDDKWYYAWALSRQASYST